MEERKEKEVAYYNKKAEKQLAVNKTEGDFEGFSPFLLESYKFLKKIVEDKIKNKMVLDYGCGNGVHLTWLVQQAQKVIAIDLSEKSLEIARKRNSAPNIEFLQMDCENLKLPENYFDLVFDGGTFSSLDLEKAFPEIVRALKPDGFLVGIETLGHNPLTNLKRKLNKFTGRRTEWAASHIFKMRDLELAERYFGKAEIRFFHLVSWLAFPFLKLPGGKILLRVFEKIDHLLLFVSPFLKKYCFKIVFVFQDVKKNI